MQSGWGREDVGDLEEWCKKLKHHDRFGMHKDQLLHSAKQMGVNFHNYNEHEFIEAKDHITSYEFQLEIPMRAQIKYLVV